MNFLERTKGQLIVSCQATTGSPFRGPIFMAAMAQAADQAGAAAIRADGPEDIRAIHRAVDIPIIGIYKRRDMDPIVYITPSIEEVNTIVAAGAAVVAVDATNRHRQYGQPPDRLIPAIHQQYAGILVMADISNAEEGMRATELGADIVATTLSGYTDDDHSATGPDLGLISELARHVNIPIIAEGRFTTPDDVTQAFQCGAHAVVVGTAITNPTAIARRFAAATPAWSKGAVNSGRTAAQQP